MVSSSDIRKVKQESRDYKSPQLQSRVLSTWLSSPLGSLLETHYITVDGKLAKKGYLILHWKSKKCSVMERLKDETQRNFKQVP